jgi:hypothetical protein
VQRIKNSNSIKVYWIFVLDLSSSFLVTFKLTVGVSVSPPSCLVWHLQLNMSHSGTLVQLAFTL